jgi:hypothetical protein
MRMRSVAVLIGMCFIVTMVGATFAGDEKKEAAKEAKHEYIGLKKCSMCHKKDGILESWEKTPHATAWDKLTDEQKKDKTIQKYYATGMMKDELLTGVQCEACHGPGSDYMKMSIMKDQEKAVANGLIIPDAETCMGCHHADAPTDALKASAKDFDFEKLKETGVHVLGVYDEAEEGE